MTVQLRSWQLKGCLRLPLGNYWGCRKAGLPCDFLLPRNSHPKQMVPCAPAAGAPQASHATGALHLPQGCKIVSCHSLTFGPIWCWHLPPSLLDLAESDSAPRVVLGHRRAEGLEEGWVSLQQGG